MKQLTFTISEKLFDEISGELSNELMTKMFKEIVYNQNLKEDTESSTIEIPWHQGMCQKENDEPIPPTIRKGYPQMW